LAAGQQATAVLAPALSRRVAVATAVAFLAGCTVLGATVGRRYVNLSPHGGDAEARLGHRAVTRNRNEEAVGWLSESTDLDPNDPGTWFNLGIAYHRLSRLREAEDAYARAHRLLPDEPDFRKAYEDLRDDAAAQ
jgi:cytochrome c-type biogenesis protein CcmH/NrfG